jgi:tetratricopeptide (TPR) repeat protein
MTFERCALLAATAFLLAASGAATTAHADPKNERASAREARRHFLDGRQAFEAERYPEALREFRAGYALEPLPGFLLNMAQTARRMDELEQARDFCRRFLATRPGGAERRAAERLLADIERNLGRQARALEPAAPPAEAAAAEMPATAARDATMEPTADDASIAEPTPTDRAATGASPETRPRALPGAVEPAPRVAAPALAVPTAAANAAPRENQPFYRRWWFWAGTAGIAAGVATILLVAPGGESRTRDAGSWGQVRL